VGGVSALVDGERSTEPFPELADLQERGLVLVRSSEVLLCDTPDRQGFGFACDGWAPPGDPYGELPCCELCGRELNDVEVDTVHTLTVDREAIVAALDEMLDGRRLRDGVAWSMEGAEDDVLVVVADWSEGTRWMRDRTLRGRPFVLLQVDEATTASRLSDAEWVVALPLVTALRERKVLVRAVRRAEKLADVPREGPAITELHRLRSLVVRQYQAAHLVELRPGRMQVDDVEVAMPTGMENVVAYLVDRHLEDVRDGKAPDAFCTWSLKDLAEGLDLPRTTVRQQLWRFVERLNDRYAEQARCHLPEGAVLEQDEDGGWRFNANCLVRRVA
jgi:hypothetical protein